MTTSALADHLVELEYARARLDPQPHDHTYLHLADLRLALERVATDRPLVLLDYGCGGSPYRPLFPNADYRRADVAQAEGDRLDYLLDESSRIAEKDETFDFILSTQVLEHVREPEIYVRECYRLLKPGGEVYLTTHGAYADHGCPYDFHRWTAEGLCTLLRGAGFEIARLEKQTTGPRAMFFQLSYGFEGLRASNSTLFGLLLTGFRKLYRRARPWLHVQCDRGFGAHRVVTERLDDHPDYIVIGCLARKP